MISKTICTHYRKAGGLVQVIEPILIGYLVGTNMRTNTVVFQHIVALEVDTIKECLGITFLGCLIIY